MPHTAKQQKLFRAAAHSPDIARKHKINPATARRLYREGKRKK